MVSVPLTTSVPPRSLLKKHGYFSSTTMWPNKSLQPTGVGAGGSAVAGDGFWSPVAELSTLGGLPSPKI